MPAFRDITGQRYGKLVALYRLMDHITPSGKPHVRWLFKCDCGKTKDSLSGAVLGGLTTSCGCVGAAAAGIRISNINRTHGMTGTIEYRTWQSMMSRCYNQNTASFNQWGGRGIKVCERWHKFENFYDDMGHKPRGLTLERKDVNGNYDKENCHWATNEDQQRNKRNTHWLTIEGKKRSLAEWAEYSPVAYHTIKARLTRGWNAKAAVFTENKHRESYV